MALLLLQNAEDSARGVMTLGACTYARAADHNPVAINVHLLLRNADEEHQGTLRRNFRMPPVLAGFKRTSWLASRCAFGVKRWLLHRLASYEESNGNSKNGQEFHDVIRRRSNTTQCVAFKTRWTLDLRWKSVFLLNVDLTYPFLLANDFDLIT